MNYFFHLTNSNRLIQGMAQTYQFENYSFVGGLWLGVYAAATESEATELRGLVEKVPGLSEIPQADYELCKKKAVTQPRPFWVTQPPMEGGNQPPPSSRSAGSVGNPGSNPAIQTDPETVPLPTEPRPETVEAVLALSVGDVTADSGGAQHPKE